MFGDMIIRDIGYLSVIFCVSLAITDIQLMLNTKFLDAMAAKQCMRYYYLSLASLFGGIFLFFVVPYGSPDDPLVIFLAPLAFTIAGFLVGGVFTLLGVKKYERIQKMRRG